MALANALSKAVADQHQVVKTRKRNRSRVLTWFASRWRNHQPKRAEKSGGGGRIHQFLWRRSRAVGNAKRNCAVRSDEKPLQTESSNLGEFRAQANGSYPEGIPLLLRISTGGRLWRPRSDPGSAKRKTPKGGTN